MSAPENHRTKFLPDPYFHPDHLPESKLQYIAWIDLMGTTHMMEYSFENAATNICKLHLFIAQQENYDKFDIYPMNDGVYIVSESYQPLYRLLTNVFSDYAKVVMSNVNRDKWDIMRLPVLRAAIAYGHLYHPKDIEESALADYRYTSSILLGEPMAVAHRKESEASPFGIIADESVHETDGDIEWWEDDNIARLLFIIFEEYVKICSESPEMKYSDKAKERHLAKAREYLIK